MSFAYVVRRILLAIPSLLGISVVLFTVLALAPGDPFGDLMTNPNVPASVQLALRAKFGLDDPVYIRYFQWLFAMLHGDWGFSFASRMDVATLIMQRLVVTLAVLGSAQVLAIVVAIPVGILAAAKPYSLFDQLANTAAFVGFSLPTFFTGLLAILLFSISLGWLPFVFQSDLRATGLAWWWAEFKQTIMPICVLGLFQGASLVRYVRSSVLDVIRLDYVTTARSKGIGERKVLWRHVVRNALIPVVTIVGGQLGVLLAGTVVVETIFALPGMGRLTVEAILFRDYPVVQTNVMLVAGTLVSLNLLVDLTYAWLDPRIRYQ